MKEVASFGNTLSIKPKTLLRCSFKSPAIS